MLNRLMAGAARRGERTKHRWRLGAGLLILAVFVGVGVVPARRGLTVRYLGQPARRRPARRRSRRRR